MNPDAAMDMLFLEGLEVPCRVGCTDPERATPQSLRVGVRLYCGSLREAGVADDLEKTVDYRLAGDMIDAVQGREYLLIERVAEELARGGPAQPPGATTSPSRCKKRPPVQGLEWAGVQITRGRRMKVVSNTAISLDGRINTRERRFAFFGSERDHARMSQLRAEADAVLVGGATFRNWPHAALPDAVDRPPARRPPLERGRQPLARSAARRRLLRRAGDPAAAAHAGGRRSPAATLPGEAEGWDGAGGDLPVAWILEQLRPARRRAPAGRGRRRPAVPVPRRRRHRRDVRDPVPAGGRRRRAEPGRRTPASTWPSCAACACSRPSRSATRCSCTTRRRGIEPADDRHDPSRDPGRRCRLRPRHGRSGGLSRADAAAVRQRAPVARAPDRKHRARQGRSRAGGRARRLDRRQQRSAPECAAASRCAGAMPRRSASPSPPKRSDRGSARR